MFIVCFMFWLLLAKPAMAETVPVAGQSAVLIAVGEKKEDLRARHIRNFLVKYNSPLIPYSKYIIDLADKYEIDWKLVVAISGVESTFCKAIPYNSYNCWGWKNGKHSFASYQDALEKVTSTLGNNYYRNRLNTPETIAPVYAPPSSTWAGNVRFFMNLLEDDASSSFLALQFSI